MIQLPVNPFRPSLARRIVAALLTAFMLVFAALAAKDYREIVTDDLPVVDRAMKTLADGFAESFEGIRDETRAADVALVMDTLINKTGLNQDDRITPYWQLLNANGKPVYASGAIAGMQFSNRPGGFSSHHGSADGPLAGKPLRVYRSDTRPWSILVAIEAPENPTLLRWFLGDLLQNMLIAFPLVLIPILIAVTTGLKPLRQLSRHIARREANDLSPLAVQPGQEELKPVVAAINDLLDRLKARMDQEKAFVQDAAHELQTPLAGVSAQAHVLSVASTEQERVEARQRMEQIVGRASHVVRQLLELARLDARSLDPPETVDLVHVVQEKLMQSALPALAKPIALSLDAPETLPAATNVAVFRSILDNLVDNALRYVPAGGQVQVALRGDDGWLTLQVADDGPGIPPQSRERVFERFYRVPGQAVPGSGLGLAIAREAAMQLGGAISLNPGLEGRGCCFEVRLPVPGKTRVTAA